MFEPSKEHKNFITIKSATMVLDDEFNQPMKPEDEINELQKLAALNHNLKNEKFAYQDKIVMIYQ